jgi:hypothetical protein
MLYASMLFRLFTYILLLYHYCNTSYYYSTTIQYIQYTLLTRLYPSFPPPSFPPPSPSIAIGGCREKPL